MVTEINPNETHAWLAFYPDWSGFALFANEIECLRYAVSKTMQVALIPLGTDVQEAVRNGRNS